MWFYKASFTIYPILQVKKSSLKRLNYLLYEDSVLEKELRPKDSISKSQAIANLIN